MRAQWLCFPVVVKLQCLYSPQYIFTSPCTRNTARCSYLDNVAFFSLHTYSLLYKRLFPRDLSVPDQSDFLSICRGWQLSRRTVAGCKTSSPNIEENTRERFHTRASQKIRLSCTEHQSFVPYTQHR